MAVIGAENLAHHHDISCTGAPRRAFTSVLPCPALVTARTPHRQRSPQCSRFCKRGRPRTRRNSGEADENRPDPTDPSVCAALAQPLHKHAHRLSRRSARSLSLKHPSVASALQDAGRCLAAVRSPTAECGYLVRPDSRPDRPRLRSTGDRADVSRYLAIRSCLESRTPAGGGHPVAICLAGDAP